jgi:hypothetical protein
LEHEVVRTFAARAFAARAFAAALCLASFRLAAAAALQGAVQSLGRYVVIGEESVVL